MGDFSFLDSAPSRPNTSNRQQQQQQGATGSNAAAGGTAPAAAGASQQQQQQQPRVRIQLPSFKQVQAAEAPSRPSNTFQAGALGNQQQQQQQAPSWAPQQQQQQQAPSWAPQQQQQQQVPSWLQQPTATAAAAGSNPSSSAPTPAAAAAAAGAAAAPRQPSWLAALPSMTLNTQLPRFSQSAGGASTGSAVGVSRPTVPLPPSTAAAAAAAGGASSQQAAGGGVAPAAQQQQQVVPLNAVLVSRRQQGNPVLKHIKSVRWVFADIVPDYLCGQNTAVLFLSLRYHLLQPEYVLSRLQSLQRVYRLAVLLLLVDAEEVVKPLQELHRATLGAQAVLVCAWSNEECARYIETFKAYENKPASSIMEHTDTDYMGRLASALTSIRGVNRRDAYSLARHFGSLADAFMCDDAQGFASIPGLGPVKAKRLFDTFNQPFKRNLTAAANTAAAAAGAQDKPAARKGAGAAAAADAANRDAGNAGSHQQQQQGAESEDMDEDLFAELDKELAARTIAGATTAAAAAGVGTGHAAAAGNQAGGLSQATADAEAEPDQGDDFVEDFDGGEDEGGGGAQEDYLDGYIDPLDDTYEAEEI